MTIVEITKQLSRRKPVSRRQVHRYLSECKILPSGRRQRPQQYPANAVEKLTEWLGLDAGGVISLRKLHQARTQARKEAA